MNDTHTLELTYVAWACDCANWATDETLRRYANDPEALAANCLFVESASMEVALPDSIDFTNARVAFTGQFYERTGFPDGFISAELPTKARVFRYTTYQLIERGADQ